jgi:uncharacterized integral membrane protein
MKLSWIFVILLLIFVAVFSVQNAGVITVHFLSWQIEISAALVIQLAALLGGLVGLAFGAWSKRSPRPVEKEAATTAKNLTAPPAAAPARPSLMPPSSSPANPPVSSGVAAGSASRGEPAANPTLKPSPTRERTS